MHEVMVAAELFEWARERAREYAPRRLLAIELEMDALSCLNRDALRFGFSALSAETPLSGVALEFVEVEPIFACRFCGENVSASESPEACSGCGTPLPRPARDSSLKVRSIEVES